MGCIYENNRNEEKEKGWPLLIQFAKVPITLQTIYGYQPVLKVMTLSFNKCGKKRFLFHVIHTLKMKEPNCTFFVTLVSTIEVKYSVSAVCINELMHLT